MAFYPLERLVHLYDGYRQAFVVNGTPLLLIQNQGRCYLIYNQCPHQQAPLHQGSLHNGLLQCPTHGMRFDLQTGTTSDGCAGRLQFLPIRYDGATLGVDL